MKVIAKVKQGWHRAVNVALALALVAALAIALLPQPAYADPGWYDANWAYRKQITFTSDSAKIPSTQSYFPALISLSSDSDLAADAQDDGDDILFTSSDGTTQLDHEIEEFDGGTGQLVAWVEVPSLSTGTVCITAMRALPIRRTRRGFGILTSSRFCT